MWYTVSSHSPLIGGAKQVINYFLEWTVNISQSLLQHKLGIYWPTIHISSHFSHWRIITRVFSITSRYRTIISHTQYNGPRSFTVPHLESSMEEWRAERTLFTQNPATSTTPPANKQPPHQLYTGTYYLAPDHSLTQSRSALPRNCSFIL